MTDTSDIAVGACSIASSCPEEHEHHLWLVLEHLNNHGIIINPSQVCVWSCSSAVSGSPSGQQRHPPTRGENTNYTGFSPTHHPAQASWVPWTSQPLPSLSPKTCDTLQPLRSENATAAFTTFKRRLLMLPFSHTQSQTLQQASWWMLQTLQVEPSNSALGKDWCPISYFSKKLKSQYSTLAPCSVYSSIKHFWHFVEGRTFHVLTDHKPLNVCLLISAHHKTPRRWQQLNKTWNSSSSSPYLPPSFSKKSHCQCQTLQ